MCVCGGGGCVLSHPCCRPTWYEVAFLTNQMIERLFFVFSLITEVQMFADQEVVDKLAVQAGLRPGEAECVYLVSCLFSHFLSLIPL